MYTIHLSMLETNIMCYVKPSTSFFVNDVYLIYIPVLSLVIIYQKSFKKEKVMREFSFSHWNEIHFTATISHDARFSGKRYDILSCLVHYFETQIILWQFFRCNGILSWFFFHILYEKQRKGPFVVGRLYVKVFYRTYHYIWSMVWQHNNTFSTLE